MRSCIYCGRELKDGEVCSCPQSAAHRARRTGGETSGTDSKKASGGKHTNYQSSYRTDTSYRTGYSEKQSRFGRMKQRFNAHRAVSGKNKSDFFKELGRYIIEFVKSPTDSIANPARLGKGGILTIAAVMGAVLWLCMLFIQRGKNAGPLKFLSSLMGFGGAEGYPYIAQVLAGIVIGAISGTLVFLLYSGVFWMINRFIFRLQTPFWSFSVRMVSAWIPFTVICAVGALFSIFSAFTLIMLMLCGAASLVVMTYEALRTEWISRSAGKVMYAMLLGYFIFFMIVFYLITLN